MSVPVRKKLIEVSLPLEAINREAAREKAIRHGHPSTLHLWWARRPLVACRAVLFASLVDDPSSLPEQFPTEAEQNAERQRLFRIMEELVKWENSTNPRVLDAARAEIARSCGGNLPPIYDPFAGGGSIPLEAQRLGLEAYASDLNPVPVLINKALIELPPKFTGCPPVNLVSKTSLARSRSWKGAEGLGDDIRHYGQWMREEAEKRIGHLYPSVKLPTERGGGAGTVIAWIWARTVASPNPAAKGAHVPLVRSFWLSTKPGKKAWVEPVIDATSAKYSFIVHMGAGEPRAGTVGRTGGECILSGSPIGLDYIRKEAQAGRMKARLMAIVAEGDRSRVYLSPLEDHESVAASAHPQNVPDTDLPKAALGFRVQNYGMTKHRHLFTDRQLVALTTFSDLVGEARNKVLNDSGGDSSYADAVATYLAFSASKAVNYWSSVCKWHQKAEKLVSTFGLPVLPMAWDFTETNPFSDSSGNWSLGVEQAAKAVAATPAAGVGRVSQGSAEALPSAPDRPALFSLDPPYYDNVPYADLSDCFYIWLRRSLASIYPDLLSTVLVPKTQELVADPFRHGGKEAARRFFEKGIGAVFSRLREFTDPRFPTTIYYAFKQEENEDAVDDEDGDTANAAGRASTGWETFLQGLVDGGWQIDGTWPIRTEQAGGLRDHGRNSLASSIVLVCRARPDATPAVTRREFIAALKRELPSALRALQAGNIAPVDLAQAAIGPGMAVFSRASGVLEANGDTMSVRSALTLINQVLDEVLAEQEGDFDSETRWALAWFEQQGFADGAYGTAETLSTAKNVSISGLAASGLVLAKAGKVRLLRPDELPKAWNPATDDRLSVWEMTHHLVRLYHVEGAGEAATAALLRQLGSRADAARDLAYRLFSLAERRKRSGDAQAYNALVLGWPELTRLAQQSPETRAAGDSELNFN
jgi:putative DNA methylase